MKRLAPVVKGGEDADGEGWLTGLKREYDSLARSAARAVLAAGNPAGDGPREVRCTVTEWREELGMLLGCLRGLPVLTTRAGEPDGAAGVHPKRLAVFAAEVTGDPHALDPGKRLGRWLERAIPEVLATCGNREKRVESFKEGKLLSGVRRRELILNIAGLMRDDISSTVTCFALRAAWTGEEKDPLVACATKQGRLLAYPLAEVMRWSRVEPVGKRVWVVENPAVFGALVDGLRQAGVRASLICGSGFFSVATVYLLDLLVENGSLIYYSGDFDANGVAILAGLMERYGKAVIPWRMDRDSYLAACNNERFLPLKSMGKLDAAASLLPELAAAVKQYGQPAYQEALVGKLTEDIVRYASRVAENRVE